MKLHSQEDINLRSSTPTLPQTILVTGGGGFIGFNFVQSLLEKSQADVVIVDKGTYAAASVNPAERTGRLPRFVPGDIANRGLIQTVLRENQPDAVINFAAETHVDRSILFPEEFVRANVMGTFSLLDVVREYWNELIGEKKDGFRFLQVSTDEVYGSLPLAEAPCDENKPFSPNSPYAASKAAADQFVRAFHQTYRLPALIARCCNNYGPYQHPEKLIPLMILRALREELLPLYGDGQQIRDWLYVEDNCIALRYVMTRGCVGEVYNISARAERTNLEVVRAICAQLDREYPRKSESYCKLITHVADRPGHDRRYALDSSKLQRELGWRAEETFKSGLEKTVRWYATNIEAVNAVADGDAYRNWYSINYDQRR